MRARCIRPFVFIIDSSPQHLGLRGMDKARVGRCCRRSAKSSGDVTLITHPVCEGGMEEEWALDADAHVAEPWSIYTDDVEPAFREAAHRLQAEGRVWAIQEGPGRGVPTDMSAFGSGVRPGGRDPLQRLPDMDVERIQAAVLFPSAGLHLAAVPDGPLGTALCRAYNNWLATFCAAAPDRLYGVAIVNLCDVALAVEELERAVGTL